MSATVYLETHGCQMNVADSERADVRLRAAGFDLTNSPETADVVIFNTCSVRERAAHKVFTRIGEVRRQRIGHEPVVGVMGCVAQLEGPSIFDASPLVNIVAGTRATDRLPNLISRALDGDRRVIDLDERADGEVWDVPAAERNSKYVAFVPIVEGCNKFCTYCIVPYSRGREQSRTASDIISEVHELRRHGYKEIHLIGQNVNSYRPKTDSGMESFKGATAFCRLLRAVAATGMERIKFTTSFPRDFHPDIVKAIDESENLCNWIHLPVQSGSDRVLRAMRRGHTANDYRKRIEAIRSARRAMSITSDIIVGFPGETRADFEETVNLVEQVGYDGLYIFKYSERQGTPAANFPDDVSREEKSARFITLENVQRQLQKTIYESYVGRELNVLVEGPSSKTTSDMSGHSTCHKLLNFPGDDSMLGKIVSVRVTAAKQNSLYGEAT
ncbi:MAG TPA: tRNA (N6-isopentenyl adenosine(37)-C2)-methylthiotransferase MiaB [Pyrinomonadaceae bacterium]|jgi:tRNA-2-methylthio-N6-dimethylallyladenosine synthase|nr:tRNA (N6-isopentenyl adenosine(37)-C2)-methylthiotransferase MiaB [Pyrinomonadaceae bacterium]